MLADTFLLMCSGGYKRDPNTYKTNIQLCLAATQSGIAKYNILPKKEKKNKTKNTFGYLRKCKCIYVS